MSKHKPRLSKITGTGSPDYWVLISEEGYILDVRPRNHIGELLPKSWKGTIKQDEKKK